MRKKLAVLLAVILLFASYILPAKQVQAASDVDIHDFVTRLYEVCLGRAPEKQGLTDWSNRLKYRETTGCSTAYGFIFSPEFQNKKCTNTEYVTYMYKAFFDREPDVTGLNTWVGMLNNGASRESVFCGFANSVEFSNLCKSYGIIRGCHIEGRDFIQIGQVNLFVNRLYTEILNRECDEAGMESWTRALVSQEASGASVTYGFLFSKEFISRNLCNEDYAKVLYNALFDRPGISDEISSIVLNLNNGKTREAVLQNLISSNTFIKLCTKYGINVGTVNASTKTYGNGKCSKCGITSYGGKTADGLCIFDGNTYYYEEGTRVTGWVEVTKNHYSYFDPVNGIMATKWKQIGNYWYYFDANGNMTKGWLKYNDKWYYFDEDGQMVSNVKLEIKGKYYAFDKNGAMRTGLYIDGTQSYYYDPVNGNSVSGWIKIDNKWYYFDEDESIAKYRSGYHMVTGYLEYKGSRYYMKEDGTMATGWCYVEYNTSRYWSYFDVTSGKNVNPGWNTIKDKKYYFEEDKMSRLIYDTRAFLPDMDDPTKTALYVLDENGVPVTGWYENKGLLYRGSNLMNYFSKWTYKAYDDGWNCIDGNWYYFYKDGTMARNETVEGYAIGSNGVAAGYHG